MQFEFNDGIEVFPDWARTYVDSVSNLVWSRRDLDESCRGYQHVLDPLTVLISGQVESDGKRWLHVSCARSNRLPSWEDLKLVKETFIGKDKKAIQILPSESEYVNCNPYCLHLWHCVGEDGLPDFTVGRPKGVL
jgi:hypothetical protein